ncbi:MAG TPA: S8 family serine peptidase [Streptosporangiaceae bacterium]|nr:S8 family serine peptidase [Streptosporangiaceae bacterium]
MALAIVSAAVAAATGAMFTGAPAQARQAHQAASASGSPFAPKTSDPDHDGDPDLHSACNAVHHRGQAACFAMKVIDMDTYIGPDPARATRGRAGRQDHARPSVPAGYSPALLQRAYRLPPGRGSGRTVAVVDAYDNPDAESDLATYRRTYGLPACTTANGCFRKADQYGGRAYPSADSGWAAEISLDLDMVSAICPHCRILLVEASSAYISDLGAAVNQAVRLGAKYVSNSYGAGESPADAGYDRQYFNHPGVAVTASAGDGGYATSYPAASRYVTAVGGTSLRQSGTARGFTETVWGNMGSGGTGSGCSAYDAKPAWQTDSGCAARTATDVSAVADPDTGVAVYDTYQAGGWSIYGGTSASSPIIAAAYALAGPPAAGTYPSAYPYAHASALHDVTAGSNGSCSPAYLCPARTGFDGPTGLGTPDGYTAFAAP